jgi:hypothetical protein
MKIIRVGLVMCVFGAAAAAQESPMQFDESVVGKIAVLQNGHVSFDGKAVTIEQLRAKLSQLRARNGVVWYYREAAQKEPPAIADQVIQAIIDKKLPVSLSTKPDFSTVVSSDGSVKPRR